MDQQTVLFSNKSLMAMIIPLFLEQLLIMLVGMADTLVVSYAGEAAVSGVSLVNQFNTIFIYLFTALASGGAVVISQYIGRKKNDDAGESASQLLSFSAIFSILIAMIVLIGNEGMKCVGVYKELYHQEPFDVAFCPYRISPLGAHIDHQYGKINGLAIDKGIHMAYHPKQNGVVELQSLNFPKRAQFFVSAVPEEKQGDWADHLRGAAKMLGEKYRLKVGLSGIIEGSLPIGGLSSSASVIICFLSALCKVNGIHLEPMEMILTAKAAENQYVGVSCGKLDQSCEVLSKKNHLLYLDTKDDSYELIPTAIPKATKLFRNLR